MRLKIEAARTDHQFCESGPRSFEVPVFANLLHAGGANSFIPDSFSAVALTSFCGSLFLASIKFTLHNSEVNNIYGLNRRFSFPVGKPHDIPAFVALYR